MNKKMNRKGAMMFVVLLSVIYFAFGMIMYQLIKPLITLTRSDISCSSPVTSGDMFTCLIIGGIVPMFIIGVLSTAGGFLTEKALK